MLRSTFSLFWCSWFLVGLVAYLFIFRMVESVYWDYQSQRGEEPDRGDYQRLHMLILIAWFVLSLLGAFVSNLLFPPG